MAHGGRPGETSRRAEGAENRRSINNNPKKTTSLPIYNNLQKKNSLGGYTGKNGRKKLAKKKVMTDYLFLEDTKQSLTKPLTSNVLIYVCIYIYNGAEGCQMR